MLLDLPTELLLEIIYCLDPGSFSQLLRVCKTLRSATLSALPLRDHLGKVPGINDKFRAMDVTTLYKIFRRRSMKNLLHGVDALADISRFTLPHLEELKYGMFMNCSCTTDHLLMAVVRTRDASVGVYSIKSQVPILKCVLSPAALDLGPEEDIRFNVAKMTFYNSHERSPKIYQCVDKLTILYRYRLKDKKGGPFVKAAVKQSKEVMKLVTWALTEAFDASVEEIRDINTGGDQEPKAMAVADDGSALVCYEIHPNGALKSPGEWRLEWIQRKPNRFYDPFPFVRTWDMNLPVPAPTEIRIVNNRVLFFIPGIPTPHWEIDDYTSVSLGHMSPIRISFASRPFVTASFGLPLAVHHKHHLVDAFGDHYCINSTLQLHIHNEAPHPGVYVVKGVHFPNGCQHYNPLQRYHSVQHTIIAELGGLDLESGTHSSLGLIMAISPRKRRIAIATWKRVQIWTVHPNAFLKRKTHTNGSSARRSSCASSISSTGTNMDSSEASSTTDTGSGTYSTNSGSIIDIGDASLMHDSATPVSSTSATESTGPTVSNDSNGEDDDDEEEEGEEEEEEEEEEETDVDEWPWLDRCGWDYYSCYPRRDITEPFYTYPSPRSQFIDERDEVVSLQPVELPGQGVIFALAFNGEDVLWAWTEHGPVRWTLDGSCDARREEYQLGWKVREMDMQY